MYSKKTSIYVHFPFCVQRCPYCDFNVHIRKQIPQEQFIESVLQEAKNKSSQEIWRDRIISSIFFGGGTPSLFRPDQLSVLISGLKSIWQFDDQPEISMEANPEETDSEYCNELIKTGINRLSIGVQSFQDSFLTALGRIHNADKAKQAVSAARQAGFKNISIDLMFGLPNQTIRDLEADLTLALQSETDHISYYNLTVERGTNFYQRLSDGKLKIAGDDLSAEMMAGIIKKLTAAGYTHYEVSNYAKNGMQCRHNLGYWQMNDYLGLGPGAHSAYHIPSQKLIVHSANTSNPDLYMKLATDCLAWTDKVEGSAYLFEKIMLGLRMQIDFDISAIFNELPEVNKKSLMLKLTHFSDEGFMILSGSFIRTTSKGLMILDSLLSEISDCLN